MFKRILLIISLFLTHSAIASELRIIVPSNNDIHYINARLLAKHLPKYLPNNPNIIIQVMPGAASLVAANYLYNQATRDGTVIGAMYKNMPLVGVLGGTGVEFNPVEFTWLGSTADGRKDATILWTNRSEDLNQFHKTELIIGTESSSAASIVNLIKDLSGLKIKLVLGYPTPGDARLALERREVDAVVYNLTGVKAYKPEWLKPNSGIKPLLQLGNGTSRHVEYPNVPTLMELLDKEDSKKILAVFETQFILLRPLVAPPNIPMHKAKELRDAIEKVVVDLDYLKDANKLNYEVTPVSWHEAEKIIKDISLSSPVVLDKIRQMQFVR